MAFRLATHFTPLSNAFISNSNLLRPDDGGVEAQAVRAQPGRAEHGP